MTTHESETSFTDYRHHVLRVPNYHPLFGIGAEQVLSSKLSSHEEGLRFEIHSLGDTVPLIPGDIVRVGLDSFGFPEAKEIEELKPDPLVRLNPVEENDLRLNDLSHYILRSHYLEKLTRQGFAVTGSSGGGFLAWHPDNIPSPVFSGLSIYFNITVITADERRELVHQYFCSDSPW